MGTREEMTDWYEILEVRPDAGQAEIRKAYLEKARQVHPDRHSVSEKGRDRSWRDANARAAEVNRAYEVLEDEELRRQYDATRRRDARPSDAEPAQPRRAQEERRATGKEPRPDGTGGWAFFDDLPERTQKAILYRQKGLATDQVRVRAASSANRWVRLGVAVAGWTLVLVVTMESRWTAEQMRWLLVGTLVVSAYVGKQFTAVHQAWTAKLEPWTYVTPLYVVTTVLDRVRFDPLWRLIGITRIQDANGAVDVALEWGDRSVNLHARNVEESERIVTAIESFRAAMARAVAAGDTTWWARHDEFAAARPDERATKRPTSSWAVRLSWQISTGLAGLALMAYAANMNEGMTDERWYQHDGASAERAAAAPERGQPVTSPSSRTRPSSSGRATTSKPGQPLRRVEPRLPAAVMPPATGTAKWLTSADRIALFEIRTQGEDDYLVKLVETWSGQDVGTVYVRGGTSVEVEVPLGTYAMRYATGAIWYGYEYLFGPETAYAQADETFVFEREPTAEGWSISGFTVTLYSVVGGNLSTTRMRASEF